MARVYQDVGMAGSRSSVAALLAALCAPMLALFPDSSRGGEPPPADKSASEKPAAESAPESAPESARKNVKLPGLVVDFRKQCVDIEGSVCLERGTLELIACTYRTKEHESIVAIKARPMHIHTALLLLGAKPGHPAMRKPIDKEGAGWIDVPPRGDPVNVYLVFKNKENKMVEHPISKFVVPSGEMPGERAGDGETTAFPDTFLFAGSHYRSTGPGSRKYLSDLSGNVISVATFGDEVLCLPGQHSHQNGTLLWQVNPTALPGVGSVITLRLRPKPPPASKADKADKAGTPGPSQPDRTPEMSQ